MSAPERDPEPIDELPPGVIWDRIAWSGETVPLAEFRAVRSLRDEIVPRMLGTLREVAADPKRYASERTHHGQEYALLLLAELRAQMAFPAIVEFLHAIGGFEDELLGDAITEDLPSVLASTFDGNLDLLLGLVQDDALDEAVRGAGIVAMGSLAVHGRFNRAELTTHVGRAIGALAREPAVYWNQIGRVVLDLRLDDHYRALVDLLADGTVDREWFDQSDVGDPSSEPDWNELKSLRCYRLIDDTGAEVDRLPWHGSKVWTVEDLAGDEDDLDYDDGWAGPDGADPIEEPFVREDPRVGRNDPCPCGSGKKFKRCCGR